jgi:glycosyltransferase involved in cell wall biosynthesis
VVSIAPLRMARGTQNKILESMAQGIPVVATPHAAKGVQAVPGQHLAVAGDANEFARKVIEILLDKRLRTGLSEAGRRQVEKTHVWSASMKLLDNLLAEAGSLSLAEDKSQPNLRDARWPTALR